MATLIKTARLGNDASISPGVTVAPPPDPRRLAWVVSVYRDNAGFIVILLSLITAAALIEVATGIAITGRLRNVDFTDAFARALKTTALAAVLSLGAFAGWRIFQLERTRRTGAFPIPSIAASWSSFPFRPHVGRVVNVVLCLMGLTVFFALFVGLKVAIPQIHPFSWDETFMRLDRALHFGNDPWRLLHPLVAVPALTKGLDFLYYLWFPLKLGVFCWFAWTAEGAERQRFFVAYLMTWLVLGNVVALVFSSAGPCYFDVVTGDLGPYSELMAYLGSVNDQLPLLSLQIQEKLLEAYHTDGGSAIEGIAAMPSLHVALPVLFSLATYRASRIVGLSFAAYGIVIFVGSVHLGWHYAVDGYASIGLVVLLWWLVGKFFCDRHTA